ncbi:flagellar hook-associated protein FlgK [Zobellella iuensis]|uniref:Flagellar hook-associated protein 1 n=1 Tax=Zobellella iuensis TaxID=2803811 RepID=A0ABS1QVG3_9GAMM|nr:flagellar hook-associated protein FlgK [Zobellella iuensis]MBL1378848.1 flagellar hook-associated protein FlgK [Zobellella iuensis]
MAMINNGLSGLLASQTALNTMSQNVANVNVPGYTRQEVMLSARQSGFGVMGGNGVQVTGLRRVTDDFLAVQLWRAESDAGYRTQVSGYLDQLETVLGSPDSSLLPGLNNFFAALHSAAETPQSTAPRQQIIASAGALAQRFNYLAAQLDAQQRRVLDQTDAVNSQANSLLAQLAELNDQIKKVGAKGGNTGVLEDSRDETLRRLSGLVEIRTARQQDGTLNISLSQGQPLVLGNQAARIERQDQDIGVHFAGQEFPLDGGIGGSLGGLILHRHQQLLPAREELDRIAADFAGKINDQLALGEDLHGQPGRPLFSLDGNDAAGSIRVAEGLQAEDLALSGTSAAGPGNNDNLRALLALEDGGYEAFRTLVGALAITSAQWQADAAAANNIRAEAQARRDGVSGVNLDEEAMNMMTYVQSYQANAKVISTADQLFNTLLNMM